MFVATSQQTAFFAGAELTANFGSGSGSVTFPAPPTSFGGGVPPASSSGGVSTGGGSVAPSGGGGVSSGTGGGGFGTGGGTGGGGTGTTSAPQTQPQFALLSKTDPPWAPVAILVLGTLGLLLVLLRWFQQFEWGRRMYEVQPMRSFQWLYRAFLKP